MLFRFIRCCCRFRCRLILVFCLLTSGCAMSSHRHHPQLSGYMDTVGTVAVVSLDMAVARQLPDGSTLFNQGWTRQARVHAVSAVSRLLAQKGWTVVDTDTRFDMDIQRLIGPLYHAVNRSIQLHTYGPQVFPGKQKNFVYGVGPIRDRLAKIGADALVLVSGRETQSDRHPRAWLSIAVIAPDGQIVWYGVQGRKANLFFQRSEAHFALAEDILAALVKGAS